MKKVIIACLFAALPVLPAIGIAADAAAAPAATAYSTSDTSIGDLIDTPATRAILDKYLPGFSTAEQIDMARGMTLKAIQPYSAAVTDETLAKIDADLAKLPASK
jgi:hypothetical protein